MSLQRLWWDFASLFFSDYCAACHCRLLRAERWICTTCLACLPQTDYHLIAEQNPLAERFYGRVPLQYSMSLYTFRAGGKGQQLIYQLKYANQPQIGKLLGQLYGRVLANVSWPYHFEAIVPVPLHPIKLRQRGYNQSQFFADGLAAVLGIPCMDNCIERVKNTRSQTGYSMAARLKNVADAFLVVHPTLVVAKHLLLVDDVATTGATLEASALALLAAGARAVSVATMAVVE